MLSERNGRSERHRPLFRGPPRMPTRKQKTNIFKKSKIPAPPDICLRRCTHGVHTHSLTQKAIGGEEIGSDSRPIMQVSCDTGVPIIRRGEHCCVESGALQLPIAELWWFQFLGVFACVQHASHRWQEVEKWARSLSHFRLGPRGKPHTRFLPTCPLHACKETGEREAGWSSRRVECAEPGGQNALQVRRSIA